MNTRRGGCEEVPSHPYFTNERETLEGMVETESMKRIMEIMSDKKPVGRRKLRREPMVLAHIVAKLRKIPTIKGIVRELNDNPALCELCGFDVIDYMGNLPLYYILSRRTFGRVFKELQQPECVELLEECMAELTCRQFDFVPDLGRSVAIDSTTIKTYSNRWSVTDPQASLGFKHSVKSESGSELVLGYKYHVISDTRGYFMAGIVTTGDTGDSPMLPKVMEKAREMLGDRFAPESVSADKAYDSNANHAFLHSEGTAPLIPLKKMSKSKLRRGKYTDDGVPVCYGIEMEYVCTDIKTGRHLYCCPVENHIPEGQMLPCAGEVEVDPKEDIRLFGGKIRRGAPEWEEEYEGRHGVERLFAWWKIGCALEGHYFRGKANVELHTLLTALAYQARQIARLRGVVVDKAA